MSVLVLIGLALIAAGTVLLVGVLVARRRSARRPSQPRTVADLVRLREESGDPLGAVPAGEQADDGPSTAAARAPVEGATSPARPAAATEGAVTRPAVTRPAESTLDPSTAAPGAPAARPARATAARPAAAGGSPASGALVEPAVPAAPAPAEPAAADPAPAEPAADPAPADPAPPPTAPAPAAPPPLDLDGDDVPWRRGALMAAGLGGGQPWRELAPVEQARPAEPAVGAASVAQRPSVAPDVPAGAHPDAGAGRVGAGADRPAHGEPRSAEHTAAGSAAIDAPHPRPGPGGPAQATGSPSSRQAPPPRSDVQANGTPQQPADAPSGGGPGSAEPAGAGRARELPATSNAAVTAGSADAASAEPAAPDVAAGAAELPDAETVSAPGCEGVPAGAAPEGVAEPVPNRVAAPAEEQDPPSQSERLVPSAGSTGATTGRRGRRGRPTPDERAAEQAAADLALLRTFGFAAPTPQPDAEPVLAVARPEGEPVSVSGPAQSVRFRALHRDGSVVGGAAITLLDDRGGEVAGARADADGCGEVHAPAPGTYVLVATASGHQPGAVAVTVEDAPAKIDVPLARSASVSGSVRGEGGPIAGARVTLGQEGEVVEAVDTGPDGAYRIGDIGAGEYMLSVAAAGCRPAVVQVEVTEEANVCHDVDLGAGAPVADAGGAPTTGDATSR